MQISNSQQFFAITPVRADGGDAPSRLPVVIDAEPDFRQALASQNTLPSTLVNPTTPAQDNQQSRFVRNFSSVERFGNESQQERQPLPPTVQKYIQIAELKSDENQRLLDEIV